LFQPSRHWLIASVVVALASVAVLGPALYSRHDPIRLAFWFDPVRFDPTAPGADRLEGVITEEEMKAIEETARAEISVAFSGLRIALSGGRDGTYRVRVGE
jgi:hypothetical protein